MDKKYIFFLGGYDLEMVTIKEILEERKEKFFDKKLSWGAKASAYQSELALLQHEQIPVLIELEIDIPIPPETILIDHHNERAGKDKKTSIEQVADLLDVKLNRWQQLISANDKGYVWGMQDIGATEEEIKKARTLDMEKQGVSIEDQEKAKISVNHFLERISKDMVIINSLIEKTSPITDLIYKYYRHIFIITPSNKLSYSGTEQIIKILEEKYAELKKEDNKIKTWSGGYLPDHGYFGSSYALDKKKIIEIMEPFIEKERIHSQHIFMFPFNIVHDNIKECKSSYKRLHTIHNMIKESNSGWQYAPFKLLQTPLEYKNDEMEDVERKKYSPDEVWAYSEYKYFHEYVRETLFNRKEEEELFPNKNDQPISLYYEREVKPTDEMILYVRKEGEILNYTLKVETLSLRIFETGIGILAITLYNYCNEDFDSILRINDFGRRIYPQFLGEQNEYFPDPIDAVKGSFLPDKIVFKTSDVDTIDTFVTNDFLSERKHFANYIEKLLNPFHDTSKDKLAITPIIDDRMFVVCWHENDLIINDLSKPYGDQYNYNDSDNWYKYIFIDSGKDPLVRHKNFKKELIQNSTYPRFTESQTLFGITRYSFMCLCAVDGFLYAVIRNHMQKVYFQMAIILLAQRASILKFNTELEKISEEADRLIRHRHGESNNSEEINLDKILMKVETLNKDIILFSNRMWFDEVSPQEQGIELYKLALKNMDIENAYYSLRKKVSQLHDFVRIILENENAKEEREQTKIEHQKTTNIQRLTVISIIFAALVCALTFWAIDFSFLKYWKGYRSEFEDYSMTRSLGMFLSSSAVLISVVLLIFNMRKYISLKKKYKNITLALLIAALILSMFFYFIF